jgi:predicted Zn finger-like uncharacterized protein
VNYRTTCPQCASVFRLGADQLDAAQGWVQCSVCGAAFDAHPSLLMEDGSPLPLQPEAVEAAPLPEPAPAAEHEIPDAERAASTAAPTERETPEAAPSVENGVAAELPLGIAQREAGLDLDSIILIDPDMAVPEEPGPLPEIYPAPSSYPPESTPAAVSRAPLAAQAVPAARIEYAAPLPGKPRRASPRRRINPWIWAVASTLLLVTLLAQTAYFLRDTLVSRLPQTRPAFEQACAALGCTLSLPKNLALLQIVGSDLQTEASGRLKLTLTLGNRAGHVQAWPMLVLTLTDQRNRPLARRSFAPSEYLGDANRIEAGMPPRSEQPLSLPLTVRELAPMGFDLQLSY